MAKTLNVVKRAVPVFQISVLVRLYLVCLHLNMKALSVRGGGVVIDPQNFKKPVRSRISKAVMLFQIRAFRHLNLRSIKTVEH
jgi:hypothetical protein